MPQLASYSNELVQRVDEAIAVGHREASAHRPTSDSTGMDQHQAMIQTEAEKWLALEQHRLGIAVTEASRSSADLQQKARELEAKIDMLLAGDSLSSTIEADLAADRRHLVTATEQRMHAEVDWNYFRTQNHITEQAVYPESHIWHFAVIALLALVETMVNAFFYENEQGLLGGFVVALSVAAVNMTGALALGMGFRYKNLRALDMRVRGWLCLIAFIVLSIYCNALFSAFRSEYQLVVDPTDALQMRQAFRLAAEE